MSFSKTVEVYERVSTSQADMQDQLCATQQQLQEKIIEKDHIACKLKTELSICKTELSDLKVMSFTISTLKLKKSC